MLTKLYRSGCGFNLLLVRVPRKLDVSSVKEDVEACDRIESFNVKYVIKKCNKKTNNRALKCSPLACKKLLCVAVSYVSLSYLL